MAQRQIGQEQLNLENGQRRSPGSLDEIAALIDWPAIHQDRSAIYASAKREQACSAARRLVRPLRCEIRRGHRRPGELSPVLRVRLPRAHTGAHSFYPLSPGAHRSLDRVLFEAVTSQLGARGVIIRTGTLLDATLIASASIKTDEEARWAGHRRKKPIHGYKAHVATDEAAGLVRSVEITTANVHDGTMLEALLPQDPGEV